MGIYTSSKGEEKDTSEMAYPYLQSALRKAEENEGDSVADENFKVLTAEIALRDAEAGDTEEETVEDDVVEEENDNESL